VLERCNQRQPPLGSTQVSVSGSSWWIDTTGWREVGRAVQTTLLAISHRESILALLAALVAPLVMDWNRYRPQFESEVSRVTG